MSQQEFNVGVIKPIECYKEAWELIKDQYWMLFAASLLGMIIAGIIPVVLAGPMICGIYLCFFQKFDGKEIKIESLFKGFDFFLPSLIISIIIFVPLFVVMLTVYVPIIAMAMAGPKMNESEVYAFLAGTLLFEFVFAVIMVCLHTLLMFSFPLLVERNLSGWQAIKTSAKAVWANLSGVVGLFAVGFVISLASYLLLCVGIYLAIPILIAGNLVAYRKVFPKPGGSEFNPPPPTAFQGAGSQY